MFDAFDAFLVNLSKSTYYYQYLAANSHDLLLWEMNYSATQDFKRYTKQDNHHEIETKDPYFPDLSAE